MPQSGLWRKMGREMARASDGPEAAAEIRKQFCAPGAFGVTLKRFSVEMNRDDKLLAVYPPHPEEGASTCTSEKRNRCVAPVSKDGRPHGSRRRARGCGMPGRPKIAAPHHEAERGRECIKLIGIRFSG